MGALFASAQSVQAGGITITSASTVQTGDPTYEYVFTAILPAGNTLPTGGYVTIYDLPDLTAGALTSQPNINWGSSVQLLGITPTDAVVNDNPSVYNVTWQWNGSPLVAPDTNELSLGTFIVGNTVELSSPPSAVVVYIATADGVTVSNQGMLAINTPEPSSAILLLAGVGAIPLFWLRNRRNRLLNQSQQYVA